MLYLERACAVALVSCLLAFPAVGASRVDAVERSAASHEVAQQDADPAGVLEHVTSGWLEDVPLDAGKAYQRHVFDGSDAISDLAMPATYASQAGLAPLRGPSNSTVPLPTGFSLFGAALLTLGLIGLLPIARRQPALEGWGPADGDHSPSGADAGPAPWFRIEFQGERGSQVRHTISARGAIDLIADLLNEGWDVVRICDRDGLSIDYEDVIRAWRNERPDW